MEDQILQTEYYDLILCKIYSQIMNKQISATLQGYHMVLPEYRSISDVSEELLSSISTTSISF